MQEKFEDLIADRYKIIKLIGNGNMSNVYLGEDTKRGNRTIAIKILNTGHEEVLQQEVFRRETKALEKLEHPNIVKIFDYGQAKNQNNYYIILEYIPRSLQYEVRNSEQGRDYIRWLPFLRSITNAIVHAHNQGIIHRDIKPTNILIREDKTPVLTDFGISRLKYELATGVTVSSFFSVGYAAPEQQQYQQATEKSDIYSLGCLFYFIFSRSAPPLDGITHQHIQSLGIPPQLKALLRTMLHEDPERRPDDVQLVRQLNQLETRFIPVPKVYFQVTDNTRRELFNLGYTSQSSFQAACEYLQTELNDDLPKELAFFLANNDQDIHVLTDDLKLVCIKDSEHPILVIKTVQQLYEAKLENQKQNAKSLRYAWHFIDRDQLRNLIPHQKELSSTIYELLNHIATHRKEQQISRIRRSERKDFIKAWDAVLNFQQKQFQTALKLSYKTWRREGNNLIFTLVHPAPDDISWLDGAPIAIFSQASGPRREETLIGSLISIEGTEAQIAWVSTSIQIGEIPKSGSIGLYQKEAQVALERQHGALRTLVNGTTVNPALPEILRDLAHAEFEQLDDNIEFFQENLAEDKKKAVRQALAAKDVFLLQGPPGTGKTTTLAEIILQILKIQPDAQILVSSQSNVAVNHILSHVTKLRSGQHTEIVRIGRTEKIGQGAEEWSLEHRLAIWRQEVLENTETVLKELKSRAKLQQRTRKQAEILSSKTVTDLEQCQKELENLDSEFEELAEDKNRQEQFRERLSFEKTNKSSHAEKTILEIQGCTTQIQERTNNIETSLALIRSYIPESLQPEQESSLEKEKKQLEKTITFILSPGDPNSPEEKLIKLVKDWQKIFGKQYDFAQPLLERANIFAATCLITGGRFLKDLSFDWAIIDEAGRATAPELLVPLIRSRRSIIVGDERQLPPMLDESLDEKELSRLQVSQEQLEESLFATLTRQGKEEHLPTVQMLTVQHRMHPAIGQLISDVFYESQLQHGIDSGSREHSLPWIDKPIIWYSTTYIPNHQEKTNTRSYYNRIEVKHIHKILLKMEETYLQKNERREVAVITPYNAQIVELKNEITPESKFWKALKIEIATVDAFQGRDCDIVLYSTVRSNDNKQLGFLKDRRRLNVALSRARQLLLIVGDIWFLENGKAGKDGNPYQELIRYIQNHPEDCLIEDIRTDEEHA